MNKRQIEAAVNKAMTAVEEVIQRNTKQESLYSRGLAREGWLGGYAEALMDVASMIRDVPPEKNKLFWM